VTPAWLPSVERPNYEERRLVIPAGEELASSADEWADALVLIQRGSLEVECLAGAKRTFDAGAMLCLDWLPLRVLRSPGDVPTLIVAVRRRPERMHPVPGAYHVR
jgi:hypothetical protein